MNFAIEDSPEQSAYRAEVREFLARSVPPNLEHSVDPCDMSYDQYQLRRDLGRRLGAQGWLYPSMPKEYRGGDLSAEKVAILHDELARIGLSLRSHRHWPMDLLATDCLGAPKLHRKRLESALELDLTSR